MSSLDEELNVARRKLFEALGNRKDFYFQRMKMWFHTKITRSEFDLSVRKPMSPDLHVLHDQFLLSLLTKCSSFAYAAAFPRLRRKKPVVQPKKKTKSRKKNRYNKFFAPLFTRQWRPKITDVPYHYLEIRQLYCGQERFLPDATMIHARVMVAAWENDLNGTDDSVPHLILAALKLLLKDVLTAVILCKKSFQVSNGIFHSIGKPIPNPWLRSTVKEFNFTANRSIEDNKDSESGGCVEEQVKKSTLDDIQQKATFETARSSSDGTSTKINLYHVLHGLQIRPNVIRMHTINRLFMARLLSKLRHPSHEEIEANAGNCVGKDKI